MRQNFESKFKNQILGLVYDLPTKLENSDKIFFPDDANAEWESQKTIDTIIETWKQLGFSVILFPLDSTFLKKWNELSSSCSIIHSLVEGWGSLARESWIPSLCELSGIPFIGSEPFAQSICMSKTQIKLLCQHLKIPTLPFYIIKNIEELTNIPRVFFNETHFIKPDGEGSGMGIDASYSISNSKKNTEKITQSLLEKYPDGVLIEKFIDGKEYTSAIIGTPPIFLPIAQIEVIDGVYGLSNKSKEFMGEKVTFPKLSKKNENIIRNGTVKLFDFLKLKDFVRMDWRCDKKGNVFFLEANTLAGLSYHYSPLPLMAKHIEIDYQELFTILAESALSRSNSRNLWYGKSRIQK
ncbi:D-alanine--D-alanine ligase family protein [Silvanigrella aquatica]|uniref:ATP-grasp domain-containing protein n=1 Tax=Silvanigrella aquatica TaxID=1915309 RepID=A0A1L4CZX7_9BACT|nr:hypothetical protein [Silvanigrella aquatica]APJ03506.1 hypothetical protein AXG55_06135 [Silvanigrella aquatica]